MNTGVNLEFIRCEDKPFAAGVERAAALGYRFVEPMVHDGRELLSEAGYFHSVSMDGEPLEVRDVLERHGVRASGLSAHCPLMRPEIAVPYLQKAIRFAHAIGAPVVNTDEGIRPSWVEGEDAFAVMKYTLTTVLRTAERYGVFVAIEPHQSITKTTDGLLRIATLVDSPFLRVNYDTGNAYLGGEDPYEGLRAVAGLVVHVHAKDMLVHAERLNEVGIFAVPKEWHTPRIPGLGAIDWAKFMAALYAVGYDGPVCVEVEDPTFGDTLAGRTQALQVARNVLEPYF